MSIAFLYTGQGFQHQGMLHVLLPNKIAAEIFDRASEQLGFNVLTLDNDFSSNVNVQLCIFLSEVIITLQLYEKGYTPDIIAGHSIGSFAGAVASQALRFEDGLDLVLLRASLMQHSYPNGYGMMAVKGLSVAALEHFISQTDIEIYLANVNSPTQIVLSGRIENLKKSERALKQSVPVKTTMLKVSVPSHCCLMDSVSMALTEKIQAMTLLTLQIPFVMNTTARCTRIKQQLADDLSQGVSHTVQWYNSINLMTELDVQLFVEVSQSSVLCDIGKSCYSQLKWVSAGNVGVDNVSKLIDKLK